MGLVTEVNRAFSEVQPVIEQEFVKQKLDKDARDQNFFLDFVRYFKTNIFSPSITGDEKYFKGENIHHLEADRKLRKYTNASPDFEIFWRILSAEQKFSRFKLAERGGNVCVIYGSVFSNAQQLKLAAYSSKASDFYSTARKLSPKKELSDLFGFLEDVSAEMIVCLNVVLDNLREQGKKSILSEFNHAKASYIKEQDADKKREYGRTLVGLAYCSDMNTVSEIKGNMPKEIKNTVNIFVTEESRKLAVMRGKFYSEEDPEKRREYLESMLSYSHSFVMNPLEVMPKEEAISIMEEDWLPKNSREKTVYHNMMNLFVIKERRY